MNAGEWGEWSAIFARVASLDETADLDDDALRDALENCRHER